MCSIVKTRIVVVAIMAAAVSNAANAAGIDRISAPTTLPTNSISRTDTGERINRCLSNMACTTQRFELIQKNLGLHKNTIKDIKANAEIQERFAR